MADYRIGYGSNSKGNMTNLADDPEARKKIKEKGGNEAWASLMYLFFDDDCQCWRYVFPEHRIMCSDPDYSVLGHTLDEAVESLIKKSTEAWYKTDFE